MSTCRLICKTELNCRKANFIATKHLPARCRLTLRRATVLKYQRFFTGENVNAGWRKRVRHAVAGENRDSVVTLFCASGEHASGDERAASTSELVEKHNGASLNGCMNRFNSGALNNTRISDFAIVIVVVTDSAACGYQRQKV